MGSYICDAVQLFRERLSTKKYNPTIPKGIVHGTYICCVPLALANIRPWPLVQFFERTVKTKPPTIPFRIVAFTFSKKKPAWILFGFCLVWRSNLRRSLKPLDIPHCLQAQVPSKMQRVDEGSDYTRKRRSLSDTRTGKCESVTRVNCVAGGIYRAPLLHSMDASVSTSVLGSSPTCFPEWERGQVGKKPGTEVGLEFA